MDAPKFIQIATGQWKGTNGDFNHSVYGLSADGKVYKFYANEGWTLMRGRNEPAAPVRPKPAPFGRTSPKPDTYELDDDVPF